MYTSHLENVMANRYKLEHTTKMHAQSNIRPRISCTAIHAAIQMRASPENIEH